MVVGADLGRLGLGEIHMARAGNGSGPDGLSGWRAGKGNGEQTRKRRGVRNEVASPVNSWSQGHKVCDAACVHQR